MENKDVDRISNLPDTVLNHILSLLPMKTAVRTSVLSRRWRYLWAYIPNIDFNFMELTTLTRKEMVSVVNRFLQLRKEIQTQRFHLCFCPSKKISFPVTKWIRFITVRGVQELDLDFTWRCSDLGSLGSFTWREQFKLPCFVFNCPTITLLKLDFCVLSLPSYFNGLRSLKILSLSYVEISDESIWRLILNCPVLESLSIVYCHLLKYLKVSGPGLMLKRLTVMSLWNLQAIEIDTPSLLLLQYDGKMIDLSFKNISQLVDAMINFEDCQEAEWCGDHKKTIRTFTCHDSYRLRSISSGYL
ncbi:F-box/LRR-repeat protein 25-like isoform X2 [Magnolia sinica]|uniref:F-box/LRR-repeat protein 25-like isoform X2 n=1 Tax=Magnolia sinica TaxID=86752 RepID=UPI002659FAD9|nr:F-box/LRR-repeat protein 25-like isoform X2 [Magnolia sinica]